MANEMQYVNPIIQAMITSAQQRQESVRNEQENERLRQQAQQFQATNALAQKHLELASKEAEQKAEHEHALIDIQKAIRTAAASKEKLENLNAVNEFIRNGGQPSALQIQQSPSIPEIGASLPGTPQGMVDVPGVGRVPISSFQTPQQRMEQLRQAAQAQSGGAASGQIQAQLANADEIDARSRAQKLFEHGLEMEKVKAQGANQETLANIHGKYQMADAQINGYNHIQGIKLMHQLGMDDGSGSGASQAKQLLDGLFDGSFEYSKLTQDQKRVVNSYATGTGELSSIPTDTKNYQKTLTTVSGLQSLVNQYRELANNYSVDSKDSFSKGNAYMRTGIPLIGTRGMVTPGSDLASRLNSMKSTGGQLASFFDQQNRKSDAEILRQVKGWFDPAATTQQNLQKINDHVQQLQQGVKTTFGAMNPTRVNKVLGDKGITDFGAFQQQPAGGGIQKWGRDAQGNPVPIQ